MIKKLFMTAVALGVLGAVAGDSFTTLPGPGVDTCGSDAQLFSDFVCTPGHDNDGIECGLQRRRGVAPRLPPGVIAERHRRDWPSYNEHSLRSATRRSSDQYEECRQAEGLVHLRRWSVRRLRVRSDHGGERSDRHDRIRFFFLNPATCAENWRTHEVYPPSLLPANRGAAYMDGMLFRGTQDGRVLAYDFKTGKRCGKRLSRTLNAPSWSPRPDCLYGPSSSAMRAATSRAEGADVRARRQDRQARLEFFLVPKAEGEVARGPEGVKPAPTRATWKLSRHTDQRWRHPDVVHARCGNRWLYVPGRQSVSDSRNRCARGRETSYRLVIVLDAKKRRTTSTIQDVPKDLARTGTS